MYKIAQFSNDTEGNSMLLFGVSEDDDVICDFTADREIASKIVDMLNENKVMRIHVLDIIEDFFYGA